VQEGKLSPEDAAELIDAFNSAEPAEEEPAAAATPPPPPPGTPGADGQTPSDASKDPFKSFVDFVEGIGKEVSQSVNWHEVARQVRTGAEKGVESIKQGVEQVKSGKVNFGWFSAQETKELTLPLTTTEGKTLRVENPCGSVRVSGGATEGSVSAKARVRGSDPDDARAKAEAYTLIIEESEHQVVIRQPDVGGLHVDLVIALAGKMPVEIRTNSGDVRVLDTGDACRVSSNSGDVSLRGLSGVCEVTMQNGDLSVEECDTPSLSIENKSGDILLKAVRGNVNARTSSGDVSAVACAAKTFAIESVSGDVNVDISEPVTGTVNIRTVNGDAVLSVPDLCDCRVSLSTLRGDVHCGVALEDEAKMEQRITGRLGQGTGRVDVSAINGDISLRLRDSASA
jgi:hypothetical protein